MLESHRPAPELNRNQVSIMQGTTDLDEDEDQGPAPSLVPANPAPTSARAERMDEDGTSSGNEDSDGWTTVTRKH